MASTTEFRYYCDRCGAMIVTTGESADRPPPRDQIYLVMSSLAQAAAYHPGMTESRGSYSRRSGDFTIPIVNRSNRNSDPETYVEVCPRCFGEFRSAQRRLHEWWKNGKKRLPGTVALEVIEPPAKPSARLTRAAEVMPSRRRSG